MLFSWGLLSLTLIPVFDRAIDVALDVFLLDGGSFVEKLFALRQCQLDLGQTGLVPIHFERDQGQAFLLGLVVDAFELVAVQKQFAGVERVFGVVDIGFFVGRDVQVINKKFVLLEARETA